MEARELGGWLFAVGLAGSLAFALSRFEKHFRQELRIHVWDVGQGDSIQIRFPNREVWLVDTGGKWGKKSVAEKVAMPELASEGSFSIERLILSHADQDHAFGVPAFLKNWNVRSLYLNAAFAKHSFQTPLLKEIVLGARERQVPVHWVSQNLRENLVGVEVATLAPQVTEKTNNQALILFLHYGSCRFLFLGDAEKEAEAAIVPFVAGPLSVLKVAHHGSKTSSTESLLRKVQPSLAVISVGKANSYGHPHPSVIGRLRSFGVSTLRTDRHGYVEFRSRGKFVQCWSAKGFCGEFACRD